MSEGQDIRLKGDRISGEALEVLLDYGRISHVGHGCDIVFFDKKARARLAKEKLDAALEAERLCGTYAILGAGGAVVAVGHRYGRIPRG